MNEIPFCYDPFVFLGRDSNRFMPCCPGWMHESRFIYGDKWENLWEVWNHPKMVEWRKALLDGDYRYCQRCPNRFRQRDRVTPLPDEKPIMERPPTTYQCLDDDRCNLQCPSCRNHFFTAQPHKPITLQQVTRDFPTLPTISMSMAGDPFASPEMRDFLQQPGTPDVIIWSNGILLPGFWPRIRRKVTVVVLSVDSCTPHIYEKLRYPAKWEQICHTMRFCHDLVERGEIFLFHCNMIVQVANFREMSKFARFCRSYGAHVVMYTFIAPWPHIGPEEWARINVANPQHPDHAELLHVLQDPVLREPGIDLGFVSPGAQDLYAAMPSGTDFWGHKSCQYDIP